MTEGIVNGAVRAEVLRHRRSGEKFNAHRVVNNLAVQGIKVTLGAVRSLGNQLQRELGPVSPAERQGQSKPKTKSVSKPPKRAVSPRRRGPLTVLPQSERSDKPIQVDQPMERTRQPSKSASIRSRTRGDGSTTHTVRFRQNRRERGLTFHDRADADAFSAAIKEVGLDAALAWMGIEYANDDVVETRAADAVVVLSVGERTAHLTPSAARRVAINLLENAETAAQSQQEKLGREIQ